MDEKLFLWLNAASTESSLWNQIAIWMAVHGQWLSMMVLAVLVSRESADKKKMVWIVVIVLTAVLVNHMIRGLWYQPRPFAVGLGNLLIEHRANSSFPSNHATSLFVLAFAVAAIKKYAYFSILLLVAMLVAWARIYVGVHWPLDILGSVAVALAVTYGMYKYVRTDLISYLKSNGEQRMNFLKSGLRPYATLVMIALVIFFITRVALVVVNGEWHEISPSALMKSFFYGFVYDVPIALWWCMPLLLVYLLSPQTTKKSHAIFPKLILGLAMIGGLIFVAASELIFWHEFSSRFNFIAVDYLLYSREVIGNIRESYPIPLLLSLVFVAAAIMTFVWYKILFSKQIISTYAPPRLLFRVSQVALIIFTAFALTALIDTRWKEKLNQPQAVQLSGNGIWEFFHAYRFNEIDYATHYANLPREKVDGILREAWSERPQYQLTGNSNVPHERDVMTKGKPLDVNLVMVSMESLGAEFVESLGGHKGITPELEKLALEGTAFTKLYATGTRTVRGLEALTLSIPPTPGHAVPMRPNHKNLFTLGGVLNKNGYESIYLYGGYSYFDNMREFFSGNGYKVVDRTDIDKSQITHENIWGVADEDIFRRAISEIDDRHARGKKIFAHVMTTSNHRPYTYPTGKIDIPSGTGRLGAVKYADYAIGEFVRQVRTKPWFKNTVFVFVADHTSIARGRTDLPLEKYHVPMIVYAPDLIPIKKIDWVMSQIDVAPTLLGLLNIPYRSQFFGRDLLKDGPDDAHVFLANYQTVGLIDDGYTVELRPRRSVKISALEKSKFETKKNAETEGSEDLREEAIAYYQTASRMFSGSSIRESKK